MNSLKSILIAVLLANGIWSFYKWVSPAPEPLALESALAESQAAEGLDLAALTGLTKEVRSGQELERRLNEPGGVNNLDLNADGKTDYIQVKEFGDLNQKIGYSLTTEPEKGEVQEIAEVTVEQNGDKAEIQVVGNETIYGTGAIYNDWAPVERKEQPQYSGAQAPPVYSSYFYPRPLWFSPFHYGLYPPYFSFFPIVGMSMYSSRTLVHTQQVNRGANRFQQQSNKSINNPNKGKTANRGIRRSLKKPTKTQRQFQRANRSKVRSGGFGRPSGTKSTTSRASRALPQRRSSAFGTSRRGGFGSVRGGGFGSRSFSFGGK